MQKYPDEASLQQAMRLAKSDAGQQLLALLKKNDSGALQQAMDQAAAGDIDAMQKTMNALLASPEAKALLKQLGR